MEKSGDHSAVKDNHDQDAQIAVSLETLVRHVSETSRNELAALRATLDQQIASIEARLEPGKQRPAIDATLKIIDRITGDRIDHARQQADTTVSQALAANTMLRTALSNAQQQLESAQAAAAAAEADRKALAAKHREALNDRTKLVAALEKSQAQLFEAQNQLQTSQLGTQELVAQYQQLMAASQKLTDGLSQTLLQKSKISAAPPPPASAVTAPKKTLPFADKARDTKRVKIRRGTQVSMDGIPGELVDLSIGGAQVVLGQSVKPNQLVRLIFPTPTGQLVCKGRVVWALFEQPGTSLSVYRTGVKFTDGDAAGIEAFMNHFCDETFMVSRRSSGIA
jgi:hypothetical protein